MTRDGAPLAFTRETIKGVEYAFFASTTGAYTASYGADTTAPAITARTAVPAADGTATVTWTTDEASDSRVDYGTSAASLTLNQTDAARVTAHSVQLTGLTPGTTYHYRVRSADAAGNATTQPPGAGRAGHVPDPADGHRDADRRHDRRGDAARRRGLRAERRRQRLLPGQLDHERDEDDLLLRLVHGGADDDHLADGDPPRPQLGLLHPGDPDLPLDGRHVAAAELGRARRHGDDSGAVHACRRRDRLRERHAAKCACGCAARGRRTSSPPASRCRSRTWCRRRRRAAGVQAPAQRAGSRRVPPLRSAIGRVGDRDRATRPSPRPGHRRRERSAPRHEILAPGHGRRRVRRAGRPGGRRRGRAARLRRRGQRGDAARHRRQPARRRRSASAQRPPRSRSRRTGRRRTSPTATATRSPPSTSPRTRPAPRSRTSATTRSRSRSRPTAGRPTSSPPGPAAPSPRSTWPRTPPARPSWSAPTRAASPSRRTARRPTSPTAPARSP